MSPHSLTSRDSAQSKMKGCDSETSSPKRFSAVRLVGEGLLAPSCIAARCLVLSNLDFALLQHASMWHLPEAAPRRTTREVMELRLLCCW